MLSTRCALLLLVSTLGLGGFAMACVSSTTGGTGGTGNDYDAGNNKGGGSSGGGSGSGSGGGGSSSGGKASDAGNGGDGGADPDQACYSMGTMCSDCCYQNHGSGSTTFDDAYMACVCTAAHCQTQCAQTDCSMSDDAGAPMPGDPCDMCEQQYAPVDGGGACGSSITSACNASADCVAFLNCENNCP